MSEELKPCPFCGCRATSITDAENVRITGSHSAACPFRDVDVIVDSRDAWNARVELKAGQGEEVAEVLSNRIGNDTATIDKALWPGTKLYTAPPTSATTPGWRCYHCDEHFTDADSAGLHFGTHQHQSPACLIDVAEYRAMEARMHAYNEEDAEIHRAMAKMHGQHRTALQREEERGYARALKDIGYDASADARLVPVELLERVIKSCHPTHGDELRALLVQSQEVKS